jgi:4-nitrophenyl phosphatase
MSAPLVFATKRTPTVIGKPNKTMMDAIIAEYVCDVFVLVAKTIVVPAR